MPHDETLLRADVEIRAVCNDSNTLSWLMQQDTDKHCAHLGSCEPGWAIFLWIHRTSLAVCLPINFLLE